MEGLAQVFEQEITGYRPITIRGFNQNNIKKYYKKHIKNKLNNRDYNTYQKIFFGNKNLRPWIGYAAGYYMLKSYLKKSKEKDWNNIIKVSPEDILKVSGWGKI